MNIKKSFFQVLLLCLGFIMVQCKTDTTATKVNATIEGAGGSSAFLDLVKAPLLNENLSKTSISSSGQFEFTIPKDGPNIYRIRIGGKKQFLILDGSEKSIELQGKLSDFGTSSVKVSGSKSTEDYLRQWTDYINRKVDTEQMKSYIKNTKNPLNAALFAVQALKTDRSDLYSIHKLAVDRLKEGKYQDTKFYKEYSKLVKNLEAKELARLARQKIKVGEEAPEIEMPGIDGKPMRLSDLRGKVVLLDFWASWCGPCRRANPHVVEIYHKYKDKGFTVFSVSLDGMDNKTRARYSGDPKKMEEALKRSKSRWVDAIKKDKLVWDAHVSELMKWDTPSAKAYGVSSIPKTFLIDRDGKIAAINPRFNLEEALLKVL